MAHLHKKKMSKEPIKIIHISTGLTDGGAEAVLYRLCMASRSFQHSVVSLTDEGKYGPLLRQAGIPVFTLNMPRSQLSLAGVLRLWRYIRHFKPNVVQTWMYHADLVGGIVARLAGTHSVLWNIRNSNLQFGQSSHSAILAARLCAWVSSWVPRRIICCAVRAAKEHQAIGYDGNRMMVIPNGYDLSFFQPQPYARSQLRQKMGLRSDRILIGMVARFDPQKNHAGLLSSFARVLAVNCNCDFALIGKGIDGKNTLLNTWITENHLQGRIHLLGQRDDIPAIMNALDLHVLSSSYGEAFPNVLAEAMACGTPCVTTDVGDAAQIVGDTGWVVPPDDPSALANAITLALQARSDPVLWNQICSASYTRISEHFSLDSMVDAYRHVWEEAFALSL